MVKITFLGTSHAVPTKEKNQIGVLISHGAENILIDCGEGTQRQIKIAGLNPQKITRILITHWHGDHILGIPGLLQTLALGNYSKTLEIYGPRGTKRYLEAILSMFIFKEKIKVNIHEIDEGIFFENKDFFLEAFRMDHIAPCLAYSFNQKPKFKVNMEKLKKIGVEEGPWLKQLQEGKDIKFKNKTVDAEKYTSLVDGKKVTVILDTAFNKNCILAAKNAGVLIGEACFLDERKDLAQERKHMTAKEIATTAKKSDVKRLILLHISQRYDKREKLILDEARKTFKNSEIAKDLMKIEL